MSWSVTVNNLREIDTLNLPEVTYNFIASQHAEYISDLGRAFDMAKAMGLASATLTGFRTPNPYGGPEVIDISVRGFAEAPDFNAEVKRIIAMGPDRDA